MELKGNPELAGRFRRGDREVLTELYRAHVGEIRLVLQRGFSFSSKGESIRFRGFSEPFRVEEVLQDVFIHAFREKARVAYDDKQPYLPFLVTIARNRVIDRFRKERTEAALFVSIGDIVGENETAEEAMNRHAVKDDRLSPELESYRKQLGATLQAFVGGLDEDDAVVLQRHLMGEMTQNEVAEALGTDRNEVRKRVRRMRERLLRHLKREGFIGSLDPAEVLSGE